MKKILSTLLITCLLLSSYNSNAQELKEVNLNTRVQQSVLIVEGKIIGKRSFWDIPQHNIYTAYQIEVYKVFKGNTSASVVEIITPGGQVGLVKEEVHPSLHFDGNEIGIFMLKNNQVLTNTIKAIPVYEPYASLQGFIKYDIQENIAAGPFDKFTSIDQSLYSNIMNLTNSNYIVKKPFSVKNSSSTNKATPTISNFTPTTVTAGTATQITINGTNFGASAGTVSFADANDGGSTFHDALPTQIISWNNNQIVVEVPDRAGTGQIRVTNTDPASVTSAATLTVSYAQINVEFDPGSGTEAYQTQHIDRNATGGYVWQMHTDFDANASKRASFMRAFDSWTSCSGTKINWTIGSVTSTDVIANDNINIIRDDNGGELPNGVLGRCTSRFSGCGGPTIKWFVEELDIVFDDGTNWEFGPALPSFTEYDFESVAVHELGHGHQLGHVINTNDVMHYAISNGEDQRTISANGLNAGNDVMSRSTTTAVCGEGLMTALSCGSAPTADFSGTPTTVCEGGTVSFTDLSSDSPTSWSWSFPGGTPSTSTAQNPTVTYNTAGTYNVTLTATNAFGSDPETKTGYITVNAAPGNAGTITGSNSVCENATGIGYSISAVTGATNYNWTVPSGATVTGGQGTTSITVSFGTNSGNVSVTPSNSCGNGGSNNLAVTVNSCAGAPVANFSGSPTTICEGSTVSFTDLSTNSPTSWSWSFPGGTPSTSTAQNPTVTYNTAGTYNVTLTATNASGSDPETKVGYITVNPVSGVPLDTTKIRIQDCGKTLADVNSIVYADIVNNATGYQFEVTNTSLSFSYTTPIWYNARYIKLGTIPGIQTNTTYDVRVRAKSGSCDFGNYGPVCQITTSNSNVPSTKIRNAQCGVTIPTSATPIYANHVSGATSYTYEISNSSLSYLQTKTNGVRYFRLNQLSGLQPNTTYDVRVRASIGPSTGNYGSTCQITTPSSLRLVEPDINENNDLINKQYFDMIIYPNPNQGEFIYVDLDSYEASAQLFIIDISGKIIQQQEIDSSLNTIRFNEGLKAGFYFVTVVSGDNKITKKLVVR